MSARHLSVLSRFWCAQQIGSDNALLICPALEMQSPIMLYIFGAEVGPGMGKKLQLIWPENALLSISISRPICKGIPPSSVWVCMVLCVCVCVSINEKLRAESAWNAGNFWCSGKTMPETFIYDLKVPYVVYQALRGRTTDLNRVIK